MAIRFTSVEEQALRWPDKEAVEAKLSLFFDCGWHSYPIRAIDCGDDMDLPEDIIVAFIDFDPEDHVLVSVHKRMRASLNAIVNAFIELNIGSNEIKIESVVTDLQFNFSEGCVLLRFFLRKIAREVEDKKRETLCCECGSPGTDFLCDAIGLDPKDSVYSWYCSPFGCKKK